MRDIKFRIWHKKESRWLDPWAEEDPILSLKDYGRGCEVFLYDRKSKEHSNFNCQMDDVVIHQYTGLKDKNGVEIYQGDLCVPSLDESYSHLKYEIEYRSGCFWFGNIPLYKQISKFVVGNIFEGVDK